MGFLKHTHKVLQSFYHLAQHPAIIRDSEYSKRVKT